MINKTEILSELNEVFKIAFDDSSLKINETTSAKDIENWDSLMNITLVMAIEEKFHIKFLLKEVVDMQNVGDMVTSIAEKLK